MTDTRSEAETIPEITCPRCTTIDWIRGGFVFEADETRIELGRHAGPPEDSEHWSCGRCGYRLSTASPLARALTGLRSAHWE